MDERNDEPQGEQRREEQPREGQGVQPGDRPGGYQEEPQDEQQYRRKISRSPGLWAGLFMLLVGALLLLDQMGFPLPDWLFSWHVLLIAIGLFIGLRHSFRGGAWLILILVGGCFLVQDFYPNAELRRFIAPCVLIFIGLLIILRPKRSWRNQAWRDEWKDQWHHRWHQKWQQDCRNDRWNWRYHPNRWHPGGPGPGGPANGPTNYGNPGPGAPYGPYGPSGQTGPTSQTGPADPSQGGNPTTGQADPGRNAQGFGNTGSSYSSEDYIDTTSIFGGVHKKVVSKNFKGGDIVTFLGGSEIDLSQAEIYGTARLDVTQVMGGTKIIVPAHWEVRSEVTALFAGFEDKRQQPAMINPNKVLIIDGTSIFGGIELKNF